ncbi:YtxH domain-containing protein [Enterococcus faecalis]|uniref:YtxH domain-containing protein n=1 Tax=Enterococcus faecalis TaxID=1351 RepID=UPI001573D2A9|nr:YtxH domain-containing protein [Enterococcus faecalis]EGO2791469.1 YtxH domain-containing protein [Enterococcus faecalis]EGO8241253.1 YtxH domain-containing protein [Enterococcus faecalis]EGO8814203.1 YtxH domain-containing protein [Enterococcus faecalis]EGO8835614.1 YtxH domain-containing protein [Enterococcus faecalis]EHD7926963.1 YtxH domain-containing protein [Enterococcus faecalis]
MKKFIKGLFFGAAAGIIGGLLAAPRSGKETRQHLINELEDYRSLKNQVTNDWDQVQRNLAVVEENVPLATEFSKDLQQEITDFKFQAEPRIAQIKEQIAKITAELPDTQTNKQK